MSEGPLYALAIVAIIAILFGRRFRGGLGGIQVEGDDDDEPKSRPKRRR